MKKLISFILISTLIFTSFAQTSCFAKENTGSNHSQQLYENKTSNQKSKQNVKKNHKSKLSENFQKIKTALYLTSVAAIAGCVYFLKNKGNKNRSVTSDDPIKINEDTSDGKNNTDANESLTNATETTTNLNEEQSSLSGDSNESDETLEIKANDDLNKETVTAMQVNDVEDNDVLSKATETTTNLNEEQSSLSGDSNESDETLEIKTNDDLDEETVTAMQVKDSQITTSLNEEQSSLSGDSNESDETLEIKANDDLNKETVTAMQVNDAEDNEVQNEANLNEEQSSMSGDSNESDETLEIKTNDDLNKETVTAMQVNDAEDNDIPNVDEKNNSSNVNGTSNSSSSVVIFPLPMLTPTPTPSPTPTPTPTANSTNIKNSLYPEHPEKIIPKQEKPSIFKRAKETIYNIVTPFANAATVLVNSPEFKEVATFTGGVTAICAVGSFIFYRIRKCFTKKPQNLLEKVANAGAVAVGGAANENLAVGQNIAIEADQTITVNPTIAAAQNALDAINIALWQDGIVVLEKKLKEKIGKKVFKAIKDIIQPAYGMFANKNYRGYSVAKLKQILNKVVNSKPIE